MSCKIIHTADWHLGNRMHKVDRTDEFKTFLHWLKNEIENQKAETLIIAGDIFDTVNPPTESRTQYNNFLASLLRTCCRNVIIVGGNHDSGALLDSEKDILNALNIHVIGSISNIKPKDMVFELKDSQENICGICCAVPYAHEVELREYCPDNAEISKGAFNDIAYGELYRAVLEEAKKLRGEKNIPIIATGHLYAANLEGRLAGEETESDSSDDGKRALDGIVGNLGSVHSSVFSDDFDYVALGHIHYTTMVAKNPKIRYSGSPFILGFDEHNISHGILSVEIEKDEKPIVEKIESPKTVDWIRLTGTADELKYKLEKYISNPPEKETNIELCFDWEENIDINDYLSDTIGKLPEETFVVHIKQNEKQNVGTASNMGLDEFVDENISYEEIFKTLILSKQKFDKTGMDDETITIKQNEITETYLPLFMQAVKDFENGAKYEN